jgi:hypothetical protein
MRKTCTVVALALLATVLLTGSAFAQRRGGFGGGRQTLLRMPEVQAELKLTDEQKTKVTEMLEKQRGQGRGQGFRDLSREEREKQLAERRAAAQKELAAFLNADQLKRYRQLQLQQQGLPALRETALQDELKLTPEQRTKVATILQEQSEEMRSAFGGGGDRGAARSQMEAIRKKTSEKLEALLTDDQKKRWKEMLGEPFKFPTAPPARAANEAA